jgi:N6-L-threonylcarbamoyladenine synthase
MKILSIETSCDETAVSIIEVEGGTTAPDFKVLSNLVLSQVALHEKYGGVFPSLAKREHSKNLVPLVRAALEEAGLCVARNAAPAAEPVFSADLSRESELRAALIEFLTSVGVPKIDLIAVTFGPGLEPALWVGINAAKVLGEVWNVPVMPINHMEGHISSVLLGLKSPVMFPAVALLISGGHTEIVKITDWLTYEVVGQTRDDAVGEAYDKVARMLGLPYPGGPQISALADELRAEVAENIEKKAAAQGQQVHPRFVFPRPMISSPDFDFSFSGLKTSVLYTIRKITAEHPDLDIQTKKEIACAFEDAVVETLAAKTQKALEEFSPKTLIVAGGVIANKTIRAALQTVVNTFPDTKLLVPAQGLSTDNALMIALAAYVRYSIHPITAYSKADTENIVAQGNVQL